MMVKWQISETVSTASSRRVIISPAWHPSAFAKALAKLMQMPRLGITQQTVSIRPLEGHKSYCTHEKPVCNACVVEISHNLCNLADLSSKWVFSRGIGQGYRQGNVRLLLAVIFICGFLLKIICGSERLGTNKQF